MTLHLPQIIFLALYAVNTGIHIGKHGETRECKYNAWGALIASAIGILILAWGGFFTE